MYKSKKTAAAAVCLAGSLLLAGCASADESSEVRLSKNKPVEITIWHYYNGSQKAAFDALVSEFNDTEGKETGIYAESHSKGDVSELEAAVISAAKKEVGSEEMPNIFSSYADTAYEVEKSGMLADLTPYFSKEEQAEYVDSYIEEGRIGTDGELMIFPIAKSTEALMVNKTAWDEFSGATGVTTEDLKTTEGIARAAEIYYNWTDAATPDVLYDGKAFYGRDAMANLFIIRSMQRGIELFEVNGRTVTLHADRDVFKEIWDYYYVPYVKGYFGAYGRFRSDDLKIGKLAAYTGSIASASYFPDHVEINDVITPIKCMVLPPPNAEGGDPCIVQQGAGMVVKKGTKEEEYASVAFLKWFTESGRNIEFGCSSGYMPVRKDAGRKEVLDSVIKEKDIKISEKEYDTQIMAYQLVNENKTYTYKAFDGGVEARKILEYDLFDKANSDRKQVEDGLSTGKTLEEAVGPFISDEEFEKWFEEIKNSLEKCIL